MAELILVRLEEWHANRNGCAFYAYFEGIPTQAQLQELKTDDFSEPKQVQDIVADRAGLERWFVGSFQ